MIFFSWDMPTDFDLITATEVYSIIIVRLSISFSGSWALNTYISLHNWTNQVSHCALSRPRNVGGPGAKCLNPPGFSLHSPTTKIDGRSNVPMLDVDCTIQSFD